MAGYYRLAALFLTGRNRILDVGYDIGLFVYSTRNCYSLGFFASRLPGVPAPIRHFLQASLSRLGISDIPVTILVENIAIVGRRPAMQSPP